MPRFESLLECIGNTPEVRLRNTFSEEDGLSEGTRLYIKCERFNPGGSIKDRIGLQMIEDAEASGELVPGVSEIVEVTSGNMGIGLAIAAAFKGYPCTFIIPGYYSRERWTTMAAYGAGVEITPPELGVPGALDRLALFRRERPNAWFANQFDNPANPKAHSDGTAEEVVRDFPEGIDYLIAGAGTGGHLSALARKLKKVWPALKVYYALPSVSRFYESFLPTAAAGAAGGGGEGGEKDEEEEEEERGMRLIDVDLTVPSGEHRLHTLQGLNPGPFRPLNMEFENLDAFVYVTQEEAYEYARRATRRDGLFCGASTGAVLAAVAKVLPEIPAGSTVLAFNYDLGDRYLSVPDLFTDENVRILKSIEDPILPPPNRHQPKVIIGRPSQVPNDAVRPRKSENEADH
ncbi:hypothetical protein CBR_g19488 [Chara braunii]|uniref:Tryptophan synthase beta chain-like PALP domain-containing protein n=1 Tax=Chara braunii TaxID=69332 RepID=A0A388KY45_CHABU|nr:hypothetical protein CBR_g19488 [Chara braunii]|eukprot:GBG74975.1 hypothetical protein CBR_g19488 [Chara braunii]